MSAAELHLSFVTSAYHKTGKTWGCAASTGRTMGPSSRRCFQRPFAHAQKCKCTAQNSVCCRQNRLQPPKDQKPSANVLNQNKIVKWQDKSSLGMVAGTAAAAGCLLAMPAFAETAAQGVEEVAKQIASSDSAFGSLGNEAFREGLVSGFLLILFSELGDKTFFIAVLLALKKNKGLVFAGTFGALAVMTVISVVLGQALHQVDELLPSSSLPFDDIAAAVLLVFFGVRTLQEAGQADTSSMDEEREAQEEVERLDSGAATSLLLSTFALVFAAEWGDKSFLATIALSAASSPVGVVTGAVAGHGVATLIAVLGGSVLGKYLNEKVVQYVGGSLFLVFAGATALDIYRTMST